MVIRTLSLREQYTFSCFVESKILKTWKSFSTLLRKTSSCLARVHKIKNLANSEVFDFVDLGVQFWNRFALECDYLVMIMREYEADLKQ